MNFQCMNMEIQSGLFDGKKERESERKVVLAESKDGKE